jgi:hypothetical protein
MITIRITMNTTGVFAALMILCPQCIGWATTWLRWEVAFCEVQ